MRCRIIKWLFAVSFLSLFLPAASFASTICGPDAVDPDGDGWGWENGASCKVGQQVGPGDDFDTAGLVQLDTSISGSLLIGGYGTYARLDASDGRELWRVDINADYVYEDDLVVGDQSFVMHENDVVRSHSLSDGSERWRYDVEGYASIRTMRMTSDGQVVVITDESVLTFPE